VSILISLIFIFCFFIELNQCGEDFYQILGVPRDASVGQIKRAYRQLAMKYHPDKMSQNDPKYKETMDKFQKITNAYEVLSDEDKRRKYDQYGEEGLKQQNQRGGFNPFDIFNFNMRGGGGERRGEMPKGPSITIDLEVSLEDLYNGKDIELLQRRQTLCPKCRGTGAKDPDDVKECPVCGGQGVRIVTQKLGPGFVTQTQTTCDHCGGKGKITTSQCEYCKGKKISRGDQTINIFVERGMPDGFEIKSEEDADEAPDRTPGDLIFKVKTIPHKRFTRKGNDLNMYFSISLLQALIGFKKTFNHLDGHEVTIERDSVTPPGFTIKLPAEGMPIHTTPDVFGDLYITFNITFPTKLTDDQKESFKKLLTTEENTN